jgi:RNA polymerase subunit RPABC4/transcription elongation factor Spt4
MKERANRFKRLEYFPLLRVFKKTKLELKRFEHLEINGHKIELKISEKIKRGYITCPKCHRNNPTDSLYCLYCAHIFKEIAEEIPEAELRPYEIRCPGCGKINNRNQKYCLYCGWRIVPLEKGELVATSPDILREKEDLLKRGEVITLTIDGKTYHSTDRVIPLDVKELMIKIKKEGYSKEMIDEWIKNKNIEREEKQRNRYKDLQQRIRELRNEIIWRTIFLIVVAIILVCIFRTFSIHRILEFMSE